MCLSHLFSGVNFIVKFQFYLEKVLLPLFLIQLLYLVSLFIYSTSMLHFLYFGLMAFNIIPSYFDSQPNSLVCVLVQTFRHAHEQVKIYQCLLSSSINVVPRHRSVLAVRGQIAVAISGPHRTPTWHFFSKPKSKHRVTSYTCWV